MNTEERKLADVLHRITPEPPRRVTVEQVAYRLVSEPKLGQTRGRESAGPRPRRRGPLFSRALAPVLAAAAVVVIAGASAGIAVLANSHHNPPAPAGGAPASSASSSASASSSPTQTSSSTQQTTPGDRHRRSALGRGADRPPGVHPGLADKRRRLAVRDRKHQHAGPDRPGHGDRRGVGPVQHAGLPNPPVIVGNTVWVVSSYNGGNVVLHGYDAHTLARTSSLLVPAIGAVSIGGQGVLTSGPDGDLYVAAGDTVAVVNPAIGQVIHRIHLPRARPDSVAVSPDGSKLYVGIGSSTSFRLVVFNLPSDTD